MWSSQIISSEDVLQKNMKTMVVSLDGNIDFFEIVSGIFQEDTLALYLSILCKITYFEQEKKLV